MAHKTTELGDPRHDLEAVAAPVQTGPAITLYPAHCPRCMWNWMTRYKPELCPKCGFVAIKVAGNPPRKPGPKKARPGG